MKFVFVDHISQVLEVAIPGLAGMRLPVAA